MYWPATSEYTLHARRKLIIEKAKRLFYTRLVKKLLKFIGFIGLCFVAIILASLFTVITRELGFPPIIVLIAQWAPLVGLFLIGKKMYFKKKVTEPFPPKSQPLV